MIELRQVTIQSGTFTLAGLSCCIPTGCYAMLMGETGSGKTTILEAICGLKTVRTGEILIQERCITRATPAERGIGYVPQDRALFPTMTVREHLEFALKLRRTPLPERNRRVEELATLLRLEPLLSRRTAQLSGGESQRVALGRALLFRPSILLLDEPFSALDEETSHQMQTLLKTIHHTNAMTVLHVTHRRAEATLLAEQLLLLEAGTLTVSSVPEFSVPGQQG